MYLDLDRPSTYYSLFSASRMSLRRRPMAALKRLPVVVSPPVIKPSLNSISTQTAKARVLLKKEGEETDKLWSRLGELLGTLTSKDKRTKAERAQLLADGLDYEQAFLVRLLTVETDQLTKLPHGFWTSPDTAKNMIYVALDTIPEFKEARERNDVKTMAELYRTHVIGYEAKDKEKYKCGGQQTFFHEVGGLSGLMGCKKDFLSKTNSPAVLLRFTLPELIDLINPDALDPLEVEHSYWTDPENARYHIYEALDTIEGFKVSREANDIKTMAELYRTHVIRYEARDKEKYKYGGQQTFFYEVGRLNGLMSCQRDFLSKTGSPAALIRFVLPELIDLKNPNALDPLEIESNYWTDQENARYHILEALDSIEGFKEARERNDVKTMAELYRTHVIGYEARDKENCNGQTSFFSEVGGLSGLMANKKDFLSKTASPAALIRFVLPELIDLKNPDALDPLEAEMYYWTDPENAKYHIYEALDTIEGFKEAREKNDIKTMTELYRKHVIGYEAKDKEKYKCGGQQTFFHEVGGLKSLMNYKRDFLSKTDSPASLLRFVLPELIDLKNPNALDPLEVEMHYWTDPENARYHIYEALDTIEGFKEAREKNDVKTMADLYRTHVIGYEARDKEEYNRNGQVVFFYEVGGLRGLMSTPKTFLSKTGSAAAVLRFALPGLIDDENANALKSREVEHFI